MYRSYLKIAWRNLVRDRQFTLLNLLGLSTGLACVILIYIWVNDELRTDKFNAKDSQLYEILKKGSDASGAVQIDKHTQGLLYKSMADELPEVEDAVAVRKDKQESIVSFGNKHIKVKHEFASRDFFDVFSYPLVAGNTKSVSGVSGVFLSERTALKLFNTTDVAGKVINWNYVDEDVDFSNVYTIAGVYQAPVHATDKFDLLAPFDLYAQKHAGGIGDITFWGSNMASTYIVLKKGTDPKAFNKKIKDFSAAKIRSLYPGKDLAQYEGTLFARKFSDAYLYNNYVNGVQSGGRIEYVRLFSIVAFFILIIACINFMNLSTAKASKRIKEVGIKKIVGASRRSLILQYIGESMLMSFTSLLLAILFVKLLIPQFREITGKDIGLTLNSGFMLTLAGIAFVTGLITGSYPAWYLSGFKPAAVLKGKISTTPGESWIRKGLVVFQFSISVILIISVVFVYQQMQLIQTASLGYNKDNIIRIANDDPLTKNLVSFLAELRNIPGVVNATSVDGDLLGNASHSGGGINWDGKDPNLGIEYYGNSVGYNFIETMGMEMAEGRPFSKAFADSTAVIFNESAIAAMGIKKPVGKIVSLWGEKKQIIGVVKDYHFESMYKKIAPAFFTFSEKNPNTLVKIKAGATRQTLANIKTLFAKYDQGLDFTYSFLDDEYNALYVSEQRVAILSRYFAGIAVVISCLGLFGLAAFTAQRRQKEIGIRKVVGASVSNIATMLSAEFLKLVLISFIIAVPISWWAANQWLQNFAYRIKIDPMVFLSAAVAVILITIFTISFQAIKAAIINPVKSLRTE